MVLRHAPKRRAALAVETAVVLPVMLFLLLMLFIGGIGVFRYQQVACLAREGARWTSVRGGSWQIDTDGTCPTQDDILQNAVLPLAVGMDPSKVTIQVELIDGITGTATSWDNSRKNPMSLTNLSQGVTNRVRVTVNYEWAPGVLIPGSIAMASVSEIPMSN